MITSIDDSLIVRYFANSNGLCFYIQLMYAGKTRYWTGKKFVSDDVARDGLNVTISRVNVMAEYHKAKEHPEVKALEAKSGVSARLDIIKARSLAV